jgi:hypothetical protein
LIAAASTLPAPRVRKCLRAAVRDLYEESWRLMLLNGALGAYLVAVFAVGIYAPIAFVLLVGAGPLLAGVVRAAVTIVEEGSLSFVDVADGYRRTWRRGFLLATLGAAFAALTVAATAFYGGGGVFSWPLAVLVLYLAGIFALHQLLLWPIACRNPERPLRDAARQAGILLVHRPAATVALGLGLLVVNVLGLVLGALPFLTFTIAYSALAATRFAFGEE